MLVSGQGKLQAVPGEVLETMEATEEIMAARRLTFDECESGIMPLNGDHYLKTAPALRIRSCCECAVWIAVPRSLCGVPTRCDECDPPKKLHGDCSGAGPGWLDDQDAFGSWSNTVRALEDDR